ncbi:MAG: hypothetical protein MUC47_03355 [Candidatus Kapabacteria bacterium]|nr:hypothetical protein [Candidatus Kapabacteria bacterium]
MQGSNFSPTVRFLTAVFLLCAVVWLGGSVIRTVIGYDLFVPGTLQLKPNMSDTERLTVIKLYALSGAWTGWAFGIASIMGLVLSVALRNSYRRYGWMMMTAMFVWLLVPVGGWLLWQDYELIRYFDPSTGVALARTEEIIWFFVQRMSDTTISITSGLSLLAAITIVIIVSVRPLEHHESR